MRPREQRDLDEFLTNPRPGSGRLAVMNSNLPRIARAVLPLASLTLILCTAAPVHAATTRGSFSQPPYRDGRPKAPVRPAAHLTVDFHSEPGSLDPVPDRSPALAALLDSLRVEIDRLGITPPLAVDVRLQGRPDVRFGVRRGGLAPNGAALSPTEVDPNPPRRMTFEVEGPSKQWKDHVRRAAGDSVRAVISIQLGFDDWWVRQKNWKGAKTLDLGAGRSLELPWLTSLDDPVQVLRLTGALVTPEGKVLRVGAEGLMARRTGMVASTLGAQEVLTEDDLRAALAPADGVPVWRVALRALVDGLLDAGETAPGRGGAN